MLSSRNLSADKRLSEYLVHIGVRVSELKTYGDPQKNQRGVESGNGLADVGPADGLLWRVIVTDFFVIVDFTFLSS